MQNFNTQIIISYPNMQNGKYLIQTNENPQHSNNIFPNSKVMIKLKSLQKQNTSSTKPISNLPKSNYNFNNIGNYD